MVNRLKKKGKNIQFEYFINYQFPLSYRIKCFQIQPILIGLFYLELKQKDLQIQFMPQVWQT